MGLNERIMEAFLGVNREKDSERTPNAANFH